MQISFEEYAHTEPSEIDTLAEARQHVAEHVFEGVNCPCCQQLVKEYRRKLYSSMAASLTNASRTCFRTARRRRPTSDWYVVLMARCS